MKKKQEKNKKQDFKEFLKTPRGQGVAFFGFYFVFFLFIVLIFRFGDRQVTKPSDYERGNSQIVYTDSIGIENYEFTYTVTIDQAVYQYHGQRNQDIMFFEVNNQKYYYDGEQYYQGDTKWTLCDNPLAYPEFFDTESVLSLLRASSYLAKTTYESGRIHFHYLLSSNTIFSMIKGIDADYFEEPNSVEIDIDENKRMDHIIFQLDSYGKLNQICQNTFRIDLEYDRFGEIKDIASPLR